MPPIEPIIKVADKYYKVADGLMTAIDEFPLGKEKATFHFEIKENNKRQISHVALAPAFFTKLGVKGNVSLSVNYIDTFVVDIVLDSSLKNYKKGDDEDRFWYSRRDWIEGETFTMKNLQGRLHVNIKPDGWEESSIKNANSPIKNIVVESKKPEVNIHNLKNLEKIKAISLPSQDKEDRFSGHLNLDELPNLKEIDISTFTKMPSGGFNFGDIPGDCKLILNPNLIISSSINNPVLNNKLSFIFNDDFETTKYYSADDNKDRLEYERETESKLTDILNIRNNSEPITITINEFKRMLFAYAKKQEQEFRDEQWAVIEAGLNPEQKSINKFKNKNH